MVVILFPKATILHKWSDWFHELKLWQGQRSLPICHCILLYYDMLWLLRKLFCPLELRGHSLWNDLAINCPVSKFQIFLSSVFQWESLEHTDFFSTSFLLKYKISTGILLMLNLLLVVLLTSNSWPYGTQELAIMLCHRKVCVVLLAGILICAKRTSIKLTELLLFLTQHCKLMITWNEQSGEIAERFLGVWNTNIAVLKMNEVAKRREVKLYILLSSW